MFELIHRHNLFSSITDKIVLLMEFDADTATKLLLDNIDKIPVMLMFLYTPDSLLIDSTLTFTVN